MVSSSLVLVTCTVFLYIGDAVPSEIQLCPKSLASTFFWEPYEEMAKDSNGTLAGKLRGFLESSMQSCCSEITFPTYTKILKNDTENIEILIRNDQGSKDLKMFFPVFGNRGSVLRYERPFIGVYDSPGVVVFVPAKNEKMWNGFLAVGTQLWQVITLAFLLSAISGILVWFLVRIIISFP